MSRSEARDIPEDLRLAVYVRDALTCRVCGKHLGERAGIHHVIFGGDDRGMGGRRQHRLAEMVTICWLPGDPGRGVLPCHARVHAEKRLWQPLLLEVAQTTGLTAMALARTASARSAPSRHVLHTCRTQRTR